MISAVFCVLFGFSLLPGRKPLCLKFAERLSGGVMPDGAEAYCRSLTWVWFAALFCSAAFSAYVFLSPVPKVLGTVSFLVVPLVFAVELPVRRRRFREVFRTSGSTGASKTIVKPFETLAREVAMHRDGYRGRLPDGTVVLATVDPSHMFGRLWRVMLPKALGIPCDDEIIMSPESLLAKMSAAKHVFLVTTPSFLDRFTAYAGQYDVPGNCVEIVTSGSLLVEDVSSRAERVFGVRPREIFGSTETGGVAERRQDGTAEGRTWRVFEPVRIALSGGRIAVRSPFSFRGTYVMGDGARIAPDGRSFELLGRLDRLVKINEQRVNLAEMEDKVRALGYADCALVRLSGGRGDYLALALVARPGDDAASALELRRQMLPVFPRGTVPRKFRFVAEIPKNAQGKVVNGEIAKMF